MKRYILLDIYKFVFIMIISVGHYLQYFLVTPDEYQYYQLIISRSYIFVEFFFIVSGFMLGKKLLLKEQDYQYTEREIFLKRIKDIYLDYLISTLLCGAVMVWIGMKSLYEVFFALLCELTFTNSLGINFHWTNAPAWFLSALVCGTLVMLLLIKCLRHIWDVELLPVLLIVLGICCYNFIWRGYQIGIGFTLTDYIDGFPIPLGTIRAIGGLSLGIGLQYISKRLDKAKSMALSMIGLGIISVVYFSKNLFEQLRFQCEMTMVVGFIFLILGALGIYRKPNFVEEKISKYSMSLFLNHYTVAIVLPRILGNVKENYAKSIPLFILSTLWITAIEKQLARCIIIRIKGQPTEKQE